MLAADLLAADVDPRPGAAGLLARAVVALPAGVAHVWMRADAGYFAGDLARQVRELDVQFAIGATRITTVWRALTMNCSASSGVCVIGGSSRRAWRCRSPACRWR